MDSYRHGLQVRSNDVVDAAELRVTPEVVHGAASGVLAVAERFKGDVDPDLVAVLEQVRHGPRRIGDADGYAFDLVRIDAFLQRRAGEADDAESRGGRGWLAGFFGEGEPDFEGSLGGEVVEAQGAEEAYDALWYLLGDFGEAVVFACGEVGEGVEAAFEVDEMSFIDQTLERHAGDPEWF